MLFWIVAAAMTAAVTALVLTPLLRSRQAVGPGAESRASYDMEVYRDQLAELERDVARGVIDDRQAQAARAEIGRRMLAVAEEGKREAARVRWGSQPGQPVDSAGAVRGDPGRRARRLYPDGQAQPSRTALRFT